MRRVRVRRIVRCGSRIVFLGAETDAVKPHQARVRHCGQRRGPRQRRRRIELVVAHRVAAAEDIGSHDAAGRRSGEEVAVQADTDAVVRVPADPHGRDLDGQRRSLVGTLT